MTNGTKAVLAAALAFLLGKPCALWWFVAQKSGTPAAEPTKSALGSLLAEGPELHATLRTLDIDSIDQLPNGVAPPGNPVLSSDPEFVEAISRAGSQGNLDREGIRSVLYARYAGDPESPGAEPGVLGLYGLEAATVADADERERALREIWGKNASLGVARVHRKGLVLVVVWSYHGAPVSLACWETVNAGVVERLRAASSSAPE